MTEKSADVLDTASELQDLMNIDARAAVAAADRPQSHPDFNGRDCVECGEALPGVRLAYKRIRCAPCQTEVERLAKMRGR
jgi:hypothetical protein